MINNLEIKMRKLWEQLHGECMEQGEFFGSRRFGMDNEESDYDFYVLPSLYNKWADAVLKIMDTYSSSLKFDSTNACVFNVEGVEFVFNDNGGQYKNMPNKLKNFNSFKLTIGDNPTMNLLMVDDLKPYKEISDMYQDMLGPRVLEMCRNDKRFRHDLYTCVANSFLEDPSEQPRHNSGFVVTDDDIPF